MQGSLLAIIAAVLILVLLLIWMNILMVRRSRKNQADQADVRQVSEATEQKTTTEAPPVENGARSAMNTEGLQGVSSVVEQTDSDAPSRPETTGRRRTRASQVEETVTEAATTARSQTPAPSLEDKPTVREDESHAVEVVQSRYQSRQAQGKKVFDRNPLPYFLHGASVPEFDSDEWHDVFVRLSGDPSVMGWVAFHNDTAGASDREYEHSFLEVLRTYKRSVSSLQREVGLSHVLETSVVGEKGKIWFLTGNQDHWFALFVDRKADVHEIAKPFMSLLLSSD